MKQMAPIAGLSTCLILYSVIVISAWAYIGEQQQTYSIFNHFISELGSAKFSDYHLVYNIGLICSAIGFGYFTRGIAAYTDTRLNRVGIRLGVLSAVLCVGVGLVNEDYRIPHLILALGFFSTAAGAVAVFSWSILKEQQNPFPRYTAIHGFLIPVLFLIFMSMPKDLMAVKRDAGPLFVRPDIWWLPFFEWLIFVALTSWIAIVSIKMLHLQRLEGHLAVNTPQ